MDGHILVATQLSSLSTPYQATSIVLPTRQTDAPLPSATSSDHLAEHASHSTFFYSSYTGTILLRLIHGGLILELVSFTHDVSPIRIVFPSVVLPFPSIVEWENKELHILAVTERGSLFRVVLPIYDGSSMWRHAPVPGNYWFREYTVSKLKPVSASTVVQVQSAHSISIGLADGSLLRLETREMGQASEDGMETIVGHSVSY